jgi:hypothetical protein
MIFLHDVDIVLKLAACDMLQALPTLLECDEADLRILDTAKFKIRQLGRQKRYRKEVVQSALAFCEAREVVPQVENVELLTALVDLGPGIDAGEAVLFAIASEKTDACVLTGDKRSIQLLGSHPSEPAQSAGLKGRILCFEQILLRYEACFGYEKLRLACCAATDADGVLRLAFSNGLATIHEHAIECLESQIRDLSEKSRGLILPPPPSS